MSVSPSKDSANTQDIVHQSQNDNTVRELVNGEGKQLLHDKGRQLLDDQGRELVNGKGAQLCEDDKGEVQVEIEYEYDGDDDDHGCYKWIVVLSCFVQHFITGGFERSDGVLYLKLISRFQQSAQATAWVGSLSSTIRLCLGPVASMFSNKYSSRLAVIVGGILMALGVAISGLAPNLMFLYFSFGLVGGLGRALSYAPGLVTVGQYFAKKPGLAVGLATSGVGAGTFVIPPLFEFLFEQYSFLGAFLILGGIPLNLCVCGALYRPLDLHRRIMSQDRKKSALKRNGDEVKKTYATVPETKVALLERNNSTHRKSHSELNDDDPDLDTLALSSSMLSVTLEYTTHVNDDKTNPWRTFVKRLKPANSSKNSSSESSKPKLLDLSLMKNPSFLLFCISICLFTLSFKSAFTFLPALAKSQGCTESEAALLMSIAGAVDTFARILAGFVLDLKKVRRIRPMLYNGVIFIIAGLSFLAPYLYSFWSFGLLCGLYGAFTGAYVSQKSVIIVDILGVEKLSSSLGLMIFFQGIGTLIGPPLSGALKDAFGSYREAFFFGGACIIVAGIIMIFSNILLHAQRRKHSESDDGMKQS